MRHQRTIFAILVTFFSIPFIVLVAYWWIEREGIRNYTVCKTLKAGISVSELIDRMGEPAGREKSSDGTWFIFRSPSVMAGPIRAQVDESHGKVLVLRCDEEGPPTWTTLTRVGPDM
jgi:hypothetical protein